MESTEIQYADGTIKCDVLPVFSYAAYLAGQRPVTNVRLDPPLPQARAVGPILFSIPDLDFELEVPVDPGPSVSRDYEVTSRFLTQLEMLADRKSVDLDVEIAGRRLGRIPLTLFAPRQWSHLPCLRLTSAAYVVPGDETVQRIVAEVSRGKTPSAGKTRSAGERDGLVRSTIESTVRHLFDWLSYQCEIEYDSPCIDYDERSGSTYQRVRSPEDILPSTTWGRGRGTCLDLSLLMASCLDALDLQPLVFFTGGHDEAPHHSFVGCWTDRSPRYRPILGDPVELRDRLDRSEIMVVETTAIARGGDPKGFEGAVRLAEKRLGDEDGVHAIDIRASRPPLGKVRPLVVSIDPVIRATLCQSRELARDLGAEHQETLHLFYGVARASGGLMREILDQCGSSTDRLGRAILRTLPREASTMPRNLGQTRNFRICMETARANARSRDSEVVIEGDLLWAILDSPSRNVPRLLKSAGCDVHKFVTALASNWPRPGEESESRLTPRNEGRVP